MPTMARQEQVYAGTLTVDGEEAYGELWVQGQAATVFNRPSNTLNVVLQDIEVSLDEQKRLVVTGHLVGEEELHTIVCTSPEQPLGAWSGVTVTYADGTKVEKATVQWTQYGITVKREGTERRVFPGATVAATGSTAYITVAAGEDFTMFIPPSTGCIPCGAKRPS